ncbi:hypothetical protein FQZ97_660860 [compost metagenome]
MVHDPLVLQLQPSLVLQAPFQFLVALAQALATFDGQAGKALADHQQQGEAQAEQHEQWRHVDRAGVAARQGPIGTHAPAPFGAEIGVLLAHLEQAVFLVARARVEDAFGAFEDFQDEAVEIPAQLALQGGVEVEDGHHQRGGLSRDFQRGGHQRAVVFGREALRRAHLRALALANLFQPAA